MNNLLQISWAQPCNENQQISTSSLVAALQNKIQKITCRVKEIDQFANSLNSSISHNNSPARQAISRSVLR